MSLEWTPPAPSRWERLPITWGHAEAWQRGGLRVLIDCEEKEDGNNWIHVSYSRKSWTPTHADTVLVKRDFIGDRYAYAVFPPASEYVNIHEHCLHLWARLDDVNGKVLPEFSGQFAGVKTI